MQIRYFDAAWNDIKNSPGWFGKLCLLALVNFIPIFGQMVTFGYLFGWAREISWGAHRPMPASLFSNEDGKFWRRGWFVFVLSIVLMIIPIIIMSIGQGMQLSGISSARMGDGASVMSMIGGLLYLVGIIATLLVGILIWIGSMRVSIYDRLSAGFQLGKLWKMFRHDTNGILRIFGMYLLVNLILGILLSIIIVMLMMVVMFAGVAGVVGSGVPLSSVQYMTDAQAAQLGLSVIASAGVVGFLSFAVMVFAANLTSAFTSALVYRAVGYWTMQFDVPSWRGQDDPMPFELGQPTAQGVPYAQEQPDAVQPGAHVQSQPQQSQQEMQPLDPQQVPMGSMPQVAPAQDEAWQQNAPSFSSDDQTRWASGTDEAEGNAIVEAASQSVQDAQDAVSAPSEVQAYGTQDTMLASPEVQAYDAQVAAWQNETAGAAEGDPTVR